MDTFEIIKETENPKLEFAIIPSMVNGRRNIEKQRMSELAQSFHCTLALESRSNARVNISKKACFYVGKKQSRKTGL